MEKASSIIPEYTPEKNYRACLKHLEKSSISKRNKTLILKFADEQSANGCGVRRVTKYVYFLRKLALDYLKGKDFDSIKTKEDVQAYLCDLEKTQYSEWTKKDYKVILKAFFKWFKGNGEDYPDEVRWIKAACEDRYYIFVTKAILERKYKKYGKVMMRRDIKQTIAGLFE